VPLTHGWSFIVAPLLAFALVGGLALVLKWAFNGVPEPDDEPDERSIIDGEVAGDLQGADRAGTPNANGPSAAPAVSPGTAGLAAAPDPADEHDFGLLSVVTVADSEESAQAAVTLLAEAGIRATTADSPDGHVRVLVFDTDLFRARRVVGWPA
jgi:hypothetical protein